MERDRGLVGATAVEQTRLKRAGTGLRAYDPSRAFDGYTLFAPMGPTSRTVYLVDMRGDVVHEWTFPYAIESYGYLTERGTLFVNGTIPNRDHPGRPDQAGVALEADWNGSILWEVRNPDHNHDGIRLRNGNVLLQCWEVLPADLAARVQGGVPGTENPWGMDSCYLQELTTDGKAVWEWHAHHHLDPVADGITWPMDPRRTWAGGNGIAEWPNGDISVSFQGISTVVTINRQSGQVIWKLGPPTLSGQHAPTPLPNGNLLLFDNGPHRLPDPERDPDSIATATFPHSRVLEVDVTTKQIVWRYQETPVWSFFSPRISNAQRLPNGNTLINEGFSGRFFEVTHAGEVDWEYVSPYFCAARGRANNVFRAYRYSPNEIERARATAS